MITGCGIEKGLISKTNSFFGNRHSLKNDFGNGHFWSRKKFFLTFLPNEEIF